MNDLCPTCGAGLSYRIPIWEEMDDYRRGRPPDYLGCTECRTMEPNTSWAMDRTSSSTSERDSVHCSSCNQEIDHVLEYEDVGHPICPLCKRNPLPPVGDGG